MENRKTESGDMIVRLLVLLAAFSQAPYFPAQERILTHREQNALQRAWIEPFSTGTRAAPMISW